jgi:1,4-dihydroxy-2-naphthoate octaprenyltransferase
MIKNLARALRLPFISASLIPFIFGSLIERSNFSLLGFILGLLAVASTHLSANLINDYADSKSGADAQDKRFFGFFGGSKLIQEGVFSAGFYLGLAIFFVFISAVSVIALALALKDVRVVVYFAGILFLSWAYSMKPLQLVYRGSGEFVIFILFGMVPVMGGYFIQSGIFPDLKSFMLSLPLGFLTTAILFVNEVPDFNEDKESGKLTWVRLTGPRRAFLLYSILVICGFTSVVLNIFLGYLDLKALPALFFILPALKAARILQCHYRDKAKLVISSKLTIGTQAFSGISLIISLLL